MPEKIKQVTTEMTDVFDELGRIITEVIKYERKVARLEALIIELGGNPDEIQEGEIDVTKR